MCLQIYEHPNSLAHPNTKPNQIFYGPKKGPKLGLFAHVLNHMLPISSSKNGICKKIIIRTSTSFFHHLSGWVLAFDLMTFYPNQKKITIYFSLSLLPFINS